MSNMLEKELCKAAALTFEELGFICPTLKLDQQQCAAPLEAVVSVRFEGPFCGRLELKLYGNLLLTLVANMLGEDETQPECQQHDALREIANVVCGNLLPAVAGSRGVFNLGTPQVLGAAASSGKKESPEAEVQLGLEDGRADLLFFADDNTVFRLECAGLDPCTFDH